LYRLSVELFSKRANFGPKRLKINAGWVFSPDPSERAYSGVLLGAHGMGGRNEGNLLQSTGEMPFLCSGNTYVCMPVLGVFRTLTCTIRRHRS